MTLLTLYARREPSQLRACLLGSDTQFHPRTRMDLVIYRDAAATDQVALYPWYRESKPTRRSRIVMHNCFSYELEWLPDLVFADDEAMRLYEGSRLRFPSGMKTYAVVDTNGHHAILAV
ncbi:MAG: hypothetical protein CVU22_14880 [Betaproteobacteria bacterium HGW-Betaproteobacteria-16]|nr:MAG: hypothetical protein CVU22_14880 [Betaproteobacteria bacterium HGW-Betaproteobacteria-16]